MVVTGFDQMLSELLPVTCTGPTPRGLHVSILPGLRAPPKHAIPNSSKSFQRSQRHSVLLRERDAGSGLKVPVVLELHFEYEIRLPPEISGPRGTRGHLRQFDTVAAWVVDRSGNRFPVQLSAQSRDRPEKGIRSQEHRTRPTRALSRRGENRFTFWSAVKPGMLAMFPG